MPIDAATFEQGRERYSVENEIVHFLHDNHDSAYDLHEITLEVMETDWPDATAESSEFEDYVDCFLDLATVRSVLDHLVDNGQVKQRIIDLGDGTKSYYRAP